MPLRLKKLIGAILLVALVVIYALVATTVAVAQLAEAGPLAHFLFFLIGGLVWILPAMAIIRWMMLPKMPGR
jgi:CBS domain containing-hemolysin-like protein